MYACSGFAEEEMVGLGVEIAFFRLVGVNDIEAHRIEAQGLVSSELQLYLAGEETIAGHRAPEGDG